MTAAAETSRADHMNWCKERAREYVDQNDLANAVASMTSDLRKHPDTAKLPDILLMMGIMEIARGPEAVRRWIDGFN